MLRGRTAPAAAVVLLLTLARGEDRGTGTEWVQIIERRVKPTAAVQQGRDKQRKGTAIGLR